MTDKTYIPTLEQIAIGIAAGAKALIGIEAQLTRIADAQEEIARNDPLKQMDRILSGIGPPAPPAPRGNPSDPFGGCDPFEVAGR